MRFSSRDVESVESTWQRYVPSAELHRVDPKRFRFDWHSEEMPDAALLRYDLAAEVRSTAAPEEQILVCRIDAPDAAVRGSGEDLDPTLPWISDGKPIEARWDQGASVRAIVFDRAAAQRSLRQMSGDDGIRLSILDPQATAVGAGARWERMFEYLARTLPSLDHSDQLLRTALQRHALLVTLGSFPTAFHESMRRPAQTLPAPATVRRALRFIDENAHRPITVDDVAAAVHMSTRGLQYAFRRALGTTPAEHLRRARLQGARDEIRGGTEETIAVIARRWGFSHPSRFAAAYRDAYGRSPADDRRRT